MHIIGEVAMHLWWGIIVVWCGIRIENGFIQVGRSIVFHAQTTAPKVPVPPQKSSENESTAT
jgi:hypothetical protein